MAAEQDGSLPTNNKIFQAMLQRRSVRRYQREIFSKERLAHIQTITMQVDGLFDDNRFFCELRNTEDLNLAEIVGSYGHIVNPPHFLVPYLSGSHHPLTDLGFRVEQLVLQLTMLGIGTCYLGTIGRQQAVKQSLGLPANTVIGALVIFGLPSENLGGRALNAFIHNVAGAKNRLPIEEISFENSFDQPLSPSSPLIALIETAGRAPSAVNAQPWRFLVDQQFLYFFIQRENARYGTNQTYRYYDAGICMSHIYLALEAMNRPSEWKLIDTEKDTLPHFPASLEPLARMEI